MQNLPTWKLPLEHLRRAISQHFMALIINILAMLIIARSFDLRGFGVFSFLLALYQITSFISECGICDRLRDRYSLAKDVQEEISDSKRALFITGCLTLFIFLLLVYDLSSAGPTNPTIIGYILIGLAVPLNNGNRLRTTLLHATGKHDLASRTLTRRHLVFLFALWFLSFLQVPSLLMGALLLSELYLRIALARLIKLPGRLFTNHIRQSVKTIRSSMGHLFSGEAFNLIFHADLFILGLFAGTDELGIYAHASLMGRFFLLIPVGIRPVVHHYLASFTVKRDAYGFSLEVHRIRAYLFYFHAILALLLIIYFDSFQRVLTGFADEQFSFEIFILLLPGYLFYAAAIVHESALEASGSGTFLSQMSTAIVIVNIVLTFYLVPFAGVWGAASSTLICLVVYFTILCSVRITVFSRIPLLEYLTAGALLYPIERLITLTGPPLFIVLILLPPVVYFLFYLLSIFDFNDNSSPVTKKLTPKSS
jgi:O-antigen/teichoic acid export membrane protein